MTEGTRYCLDSITSLLGDRKSSSVSKLPVEHSLLAVTFAPLWGLCNISLFDK